MDVNPYESPTDLPDPHGPERKRRFKKRLGWLGLGILLFFVAFVINDTLQVWLIQRRASSRSGSSLPATQQPGALTP